MALEINKNGILSDIAKEMIDNSHTLKVGKVGGYSIEDVDTCTSYIYYEDKIRRDADLKQIKKLIKDAKN